jgi:hypothetical protein
LDEFTDQLKLRVHQQTSFVFIRDDALLSFESCPNPQRSRGEPAALPRRFERNPDETRKRRTRLSPLSAIAFSSMA